MRTERLPAEAGAEFVNQRRVEDIRVTDAGHLVGERVHEKHGHWVKPALRDLAGEVASVDALCHAGLHCAVQAPVGAKRISGNRGTESPAGKETVGVRTYSAVRIPNAEIDRRRVFAEITVAHTSCGNREDLVAVQMQNLMVE